nr:Gag-Pol polyprotein [Tanacetum cinerariifolium]
VVSTVQTKTLTINPSSASLAPQDRWSRDKHIKLVNIVDFLSKEPKKVIEALKHLGWVNAMQEKLKQFFRNKVWTLVPPPYGKTIIGSKWIFRNKMDETGILIKNKTGLVAQGYCKIPIFTNIAAEANLRLLDALEMKQDSGAEEVISRT